MNRLYRKTVTLRCTVNQEARVILPPEEGVPGDVGGPGKSIYRTVQVIVPDQPAVFVEIDGKIQGSFNEDGQGLDRNYTRPKLSSGAQISMAILPEQYLVAQAEEAMVVITLIVEYWEES